MDDIEALGGEANLRELVQNIRSDDETERKQTISQIPELILKSLQKKNDVLNQLLLVIYNLTTDSNYYETLNGSNSTLIVRHLLRLYTQTIQDHNHKQIYALSELVQLVQSSELLAELAYVLHRCTDNLSKEDSEAVEEALGSIQEKAAADLCPEALLMIHSIVAIK